MAQVAIFKEIFDQVRKDLDCELFYSELKRHNVSHYIYYLATDNIHIVLENDNTVLIKGLKVVNVKFSRNTHLIETSYDRLKSREITFQQYRENLAKAGVFRWVTNIHEHKRYYYTFDNSLLFTREHSGTLHTNLSTLNHNVRFLPVSAPGRWHTAIRVRAKPCVHRFNYSRTSRRSSPSGLWT